MIEEADTAISHPDTVVIHAQSALIAGVAMLGTRWHNLFTSFAVGELADFG